MYNNNLHVSYLGLVALLNPLARKDRLRLIWLILPLLISLLTGCALKRDQYDTPQIPLPDGYVGPSAVAGAAEGDPLKPRDSELAGWWRLFDSQELDTLVDRALANNQDLRIAAQRVLQAKARAIQGKAGQYPEVSLPVQYNAEAPKDGIGTVEKDGEVESEETYQLGLNVNWRVDLWGEQSSLAESAELQLWRAIFDHDDQARKLVAELVGAYIEYLSLNDRMRVARETEVVMSNMLSAMEARLASGDATLIDVEQQRAAVFSVRSDMPEIELRRKQIANRLALLVGGVPEGLSLSDQGLGELLYPRVKPGVPAALLRQRPDVRAIEARLLAADANIDVARARVMPPLDLTAQVGYGSLYIDEVFMPHTLYWNFIANLSATIFDAGRRQSEVDFNKAAHEEMVETYVKVIHAATLEVETALQTIELTRKRLAIQQEATDAAHRAWMYSEEAYDAGSIDYLVYLDTVRTYHRNLDQLYTFRRNTYQGQVDLFNSLGGGAPIRQPLPGKGWRPEKQPGSIVAGEGKPLKVQGHWLPSGGWGTKGRSDQMDQSSHDRSSMDQESWLVELTGDHSREGVEAAWRDLRNHNPKLVERHSLLARLPQDTVKPEGDAATWYRLAVEEFTTRDDAEKWCKRLNFGKMRCKVIELDPDIDIAGRFPWPDPLEKDLAQVTTGAYTSPSAPSTQMDKAGK